MVYIDGDIRIPLIKRRILTTSSKIAISELNHHGLTASEKSGKIKKITVHTTHHADDTRPKKDNAFGMYFVFSHK